MAISSKHVEEELDNAKKVFFNKESTLDDKINALYRLIQATLKVVTINRSNSKLIMRHLHITIPKSTKETLTEDGTKTVKIDVESKVEEIKEE